MTQTSYCSGSGTQNLKLPVAHLLWPPSACCLDILFAYSLNRHSLGTKGPEFVPENTGESHVLKDKRSNVRFEVFTAVTMKNAVFWDIKPTKYFTGDTLRLHYSVQPVNAI
jgi:hypothetical protein